MTPSNYFETALDLQRSGVCHFYEYSGIGFFLFLAFGFCLILSLCIASSWLSAVAQCVVIYSLSAVDLFVITFVITKFATLQAAARS